MNLKLVYTGRVTDVIKIHRSKEMKEMILRNFAGMDIEISIEKKKKRRGLAQNNYYWCVIVPMVQSGLQDAGYKVSKESTHEFLKATFNKQELVNEQTGEILQTVGSTAQMTTVQMMEYFMEISQWAVEFLSINIPEPGEQIKLL
jgi:hypothetical protein